MPVTDVTPLQWAAWTAIVTVAFAVPLLVVAAVRWLRRRT